jgi:hypothetical protein
MHWNIEVTIIVVLVSKPCFIVLLQGTSYQCFPKLFHMLQEINTNLCCKHISYHFMWLFDSKLHETFPGVTIDREWCETHERSDINTHLHYQAWAPNIHTWDTINKSMLHMFQGGVANTFHIHMSHMFHARIWTIEA